MNEVEWDTSALPYSMLDDLRARAGGHPDARRMRLFSCACCREVWHLLTDERSRHAVEVAERYAENLATVEELDTAGDGASTAARAMRKDPFKDAAWAACNAMGRDEETWMGASSTSNSASRALAKAAAKKVAAREAHQASALARQGAVLRDIFGNPFRPLPIDPAWVTPSLIRLARKAYDDRVLPSGELDTTRLAKLADALEAAGADACLVGHLRAPGPHVRGCWAVDAVLGRGLSVLGAAPPAPQTSAASAQKEYKHAPCIAGQNEDGTYSLAFTEFDRTATVFEEMGREGGGYDWHGVVEALVRMRAPKLRPKLHYVPEGSMFAVMSKDEDAIKQVAELIRAAINDPALLKEAIANADPNLMDP